MTLTLTTARAVGISQCSSEQKWEDETPHEVGSVMTVESDCTSAACKRARENRLFGVRVTFFVTFSSCSHLKIYMYGIPFLK